MALISQNELHGLVDAIAGSGIDLIESRRVFIQGVDPRYIGSLPNVGGGIGQIMVDLTQMNNVERLTTGQIPMEIYLNNVSLLLKNRNEEGIVRKILDNIAHVANGTPRVAPRQPDIQQQVIHRDDTVAQEYIEAAYRLGASTMKLMVPSFSNGQIRKMPNGQDMIFLGTGWLASNALVITNHHVINARKEFENLAGENDLKLQASAMTGQFDYNSESNQPLNATFSHLEAWNADLDYAVVRLKEATQREPLKLCNKAIVVGTDPIPVNIIQHPNGRPKRYGIRNNLMHFADNVELRYFTDTDFGSSGSAVMNDAWTVVGLHRGASFIDGVQFQGKPTAYVNTGTQITAIVADIKTRYPALAAEMGL